MDRPSPHRRQPPDPDRRQPPVLDRHPSPDGSQPPDPNLQAHRGRGALSARAGRYESASYAAFDDGWGSIEDRDDAAPKTRITPEFPRRILSRNSSPDIPFDRSINPYQGCEHGCIYCYARPTHAYNGLGAGIDFETRIFSKPDAPALLRAELRARNYRPATVVLGGNTDPYQPAERTLRITRSVLEVLRDFNHPTGLITKGRGVVRDIDVLAPMAEKNLARVAISVTTLDPELSRRLEPRAAAPGARLKAIERLTEAGIPVLVMVAPIIPQVNDAEIEAIVQAVADAGARSAGYVFLRLPMEVGPLFEEWLGEHMPLRKDHVMELVRQCRGGGQYQPEFGIRMRGTGPYAELVERRFKLAVRRAGIAQPLPPLSTEHFAVPPQAGDQMRLF